MWILGGLNSDWVTHSNMSVHTSPGFHTERGLSGIPNQGRERMCCEVFYLTQTANLDGVVFFYGSLPFLLGLFLFSSSFWSRSSLVSSATPMQYSSCSSSSPSELIWLSSYSAQSIFSSIVVPRELDTWVT